MSKTRILIHIVFSTKRRERTINTFHRKELYAYIWGIVKNKNCYLHRIDGITDHVHMLIDLHPSIALADLVKEIKTASNLWLKENPHFPKFDRWGSGYYAVSISCDEMEACKNYIMNQETHHLGTGFMAEMEWMALKNSLTWYKDDWE